MGGTTVFDAQITRDALGRITQRIEVIDGIPRVFEYGYDVAGRLATVHRNGTLVVLYTYDSNGTYGFDVTVAGAKGVNGP